VHIGRKTRGRTDGTVITIKSFSLLTDMKEVLQNLAEACKELTYGARYVERHGQRNHRRTLLKMQQGNYRDGSWPLESERE